MPRITVYVPDDLKARMDDAGEDVNWSAVAQLAFRGAIATYALKKDSTNMTGVIERLRASKKRSEEADIAFGHKAGSQWAKLSAEYDELNRIYEELEQIGSFAAMDDGLWRLQRLIDPEDTMDRHDWEAFWSDIGEDRPTDCFARGFIAGAVEVFEEVKEEL